MTIPPNSPADSMPDVPKTPDSTANLAKGFHQIFISQIVALVAVVLCVLTVIGGLAALGIGVTGTGGASLYNALAFLLAGSGILLIACMGCAIVSFVLSFVGIYSCSKDDPRYKTLFWIGIVCLVLNVFGNQYILGLNVGLIINYVQLGVSLFCLVYSVEIIEAHGPDYLADKGRQLIKVFGLICVILAASALLGLLGMILIAEIGSLAASILGIYYVISVMGFYKKASAALTEQESQD